MRRTALLVTAAAMLVFGLVGCSEETAGDPGASGDNGGLTDVPSFPEDTATSEAPTQPSEAESGTTDLQPCELLTDAEMAQLSLGAGNEAEIGPARRCQWQASGQHTVTVGVIDELGIDEVVSTTEPEPTTVGGHDAVRYSTAGGVCALAIAVTESSRVDVSGVAGGDMTKACTVATRAAELVEPKLP
ncbi:DUF3558 domain-containing protein [Actinophytocola xanthii]|uniref:DUF3558 domain-containing protein n=1 Tax=Actinophytocola xanthii TaxID=1912961 RepID=A0A1Q8C0M0_9PSEU|nr:DUF3558 domain-containing protein [Actinophytocola xanthii]OLF07920.1 hypothetical protein BU204_35225 [Actinophytocola xanthii]